jgi:16S rRNA (adenine1518-N6/adenine1519-N6)-dimethyltransferase
MKAKKSLGQHFLNSQEALLRIIEAAVFLEGEFVLEIGPGQGVLTEKLLEISSKVVAVETDSRMVNFLQHKFGKEIRNGKLVLIEKNILELDPLELKNYGNSYKIVANIPYYITGEILRQFLSADFKPKGAVLLIQKEVAERIVVKDSKQSILSVSVAVFGKASSAGVVKAEDFIPAPKVDSEILVIEEINNDFFREVDEKKFFETVRRGFSHKRKVLLNNFEKEDRIKIEDYLKSKNLSLKIRAEKLTITDWREVANLL